MKTHTTNYFNTLIEVADDCPVSNCEVPPEKKEKSIALMQYERLVKNPYKYNSDDLIFEVFAVRKGLKKSEYKTERELFFSKGQPCLRSSPLTKRYGFGVHADQAGKIAIFGQDSAEYKKLQKDKAVIKVKAMRSARK